MPGPVTFRPATHNANPVYGDRTKPLSAEEMFSRCCPSQYDTSDEILQSSFSQDGASGPRHVTSTNGLVQTLIQAYNQHHAVVIRPDDVWLAILTQFSFFVNANAEHLRSSFVAHEGKKEIKITYDGVNRYSKIFARFAKDVISAMEEHLTDKSVREWILPSFSTTTELDTVVSSIVMMATMKKYFDYTCEMMCGIPQVTLEGEKSDWENLFDRLSKLKEYDINGEMNRWHDMLRVVLSHFVSAFDDPSGEANINFWQKICHWQNNGSGPTFVSGWITALCVFDQDGKWIGHPLNDNNVSASFPVDRKEYRPSSRALNGAIFHTIKSADVPLGYVEVDVKLIDNGVELESKMVAGLVGARVASSDDKSLSKDGEEDTLHPQVGWWIYTLRKGQSRREAEMEKIMERLSRNEN